MNTTTKTLAALTGLALVAGSAHAAIIVPNSKISAGSAEGTLLAIDTPTNGDVNVADAGWALTSGASGDNSAGSRYWEPDGTVTQANAGMKVIINGGTATWTFDLPDGTIIKSVYVSWGKTQGNTPGGTYSYSETAADSEYLNQLVNPAGDLKLDWLDSLGGTHTGWFTRLGFSDIVVAGGDGFVLTTQAQNLAWSDAVVVDYVPEPGSLALLGLGGLLIARRRRG